VPGDWPGAQLHNDEVVPILFAPELAFAKSTLFVSLLDKAGFQLTRVMPTDTRNRREFVDAVGAIAVVCPHVAGARHQTTPVIGFLDRTCHSVESSKIGRGRLR
jgi:hypothetical protein